MEKTAAKPLMIGSGKRWQTPMQGEGLRQLNQCGRKIKYPSEESALRGAASMEKKKAEKFDAYECPYCAGWHIGHAYEENTGPRITKLCPSCRVEQTFTICSVCLSFVWAGTHDSECLNPFIKPCEHLSGVPGENNQ